MDKVSLRLSEEEKELLRRQAEEAGVSVSELIRDRLFPRNLSGTPATFGQVSGLAERVATLSAAVERLSETAEQSSCPEPVREPTADARLDGIEQILRGLSGQLAEIREALSKREQSGSSWSSFLSRNK